MLESSLAELLIHPETGEPLHEDRLGFTSSQRAPIPIEHGIPRFVEQEAFTESFGYQWNRFDVQSPGEDEATFQAKVGISLSDLAGKRVLDAGCGGGRYSLVAADHGAQVVSVDRSRAVEKALQLVGQRKHVLFLQADLQALPLIPESFDLVFSIGVLHHSPQTQAAFESIAKMVKPGGRLSVWVYRLNTRPQEWINSGLRHVARWMPRSVLMRGCEALALFGGVPVIASLANKVVPFSAHPHWSNRVCDTFDWYSPHYQHHHTPNEVFGWFKNSGFTEIHELPPEKVGRLYLLVWKAGMIIGSGVNITGIKKVC